MRITSLDALAGLGAIAVGLWIAHPHTPAKPPPEWIVGQQGATNEALDCYGDSVAVDRVIRDRTADGAIGANDTRITEMIRSQGITLDVDQAFEVHNIIGRDAELELSGGAFDQFACWVFIPDAKLVVRIAPEHLVEYGYH